MSDNAFKFLLQDDSQPFFPSRCYVVADPAVAERDQWSVELDEPVGERWVHRIDDIKDWMLHGEKDTRQMIFDRNDRFTPFRTLHRDEVFRAYLRKLLDRLPPEYESHRKHALMPSIAEEKTRNRYKDAVEAAIPGITLLPEPEMVAEYFRLVKGTLELEERRNNVILVVDVGASTANMTLIVSRRDQKIVSAGKKGTQRDLRLRALRGDSVGHAGRWVDIRLAGMLGMPETAEALREVESAKIRVSLSGKSTAFESGTTTKPSSLTRKTLSSVSKELWFHLRPLFEKLCERLYENQTSSIDAKRLSADRMEELGVKAPQEAYRLIDTVLLAGGTSLLPGFDEAMMETLFPEGEHPKVLRVGSSFAIAAAAGGLAHILQNYDPPRLRSRRADNNEVRSAPLESTLPDSLLLGIKQPGELEQRIAVLDANDPFVDDGGVRPIEGLPALAAGSHPKMRLVPGLGAGLSARQGRPFKAMDVRQSPGKMSLKWDPDEEKAFILSDQIDGTGYLWIEGKDFRKRSEPALTPFEGELATGDLAIDGAEDVILDLGMSKIVVMTAQRGRTSASELEHLMRDGIGRGPGESASPAAVTVSTSELVDSIDDQPPAAPKGKEEKSRDQDGKASANNPARLKDAAAPPQSATAPKDGSVAITPGVDRASHVSNEWGNRVSETVFSNALLSLKEAVIRNEPTFNFDDVVVTLLALTVRPVVLLAGPPGCGKSSLVRMIARMLGMTRGETFHEIAVQAHWENDGVLFGDSGLLRPVLGETSNQHLILFDEFNLTRPEYYLSRFFHALDGGHGHLESGLSIAPCRILGTMNVDDFSRPPSPKVIDRCFLLELAQIPWHSESGGMVELRDVDPLPGLPVVSYGGAGKDERIERILDALHVAVHEHGLRHDLLPSRRVLGDIRSILNLHHQLDLQAKGLLDRGELVDRIVASRILVKLSGAIDQVQPALEALERAANGLDELVRTKARLKLARHQARLGFVSPWQ
ncbi:energy-coupling factor transporter ATP-binding protein EcfA2 [Rhizobium azooxidifex]|uniref:Energy-coupling factor transporter ATP-binding protein EcfA2 n=1 Tax=Mycoplana azooxidifex TaxID=1636188 RepID=A0A7W6DF93_9HYPH|nr:AAA family ATPase [Mycoplana azooxidifex]MBB3979542.1 energy-coupling factor transporter ATP-binding protein EcfA2 [Mycoplana azooxidifex]